MRRERRTLDKVPSHLACKRFVRCTITFESKAGLAARLPLTPSRCAAASPSAETALSVAESRPGRVNIQHLPRGAYLPSLSRLIRRVMIAPCLSQSLSMDPPS